MMIRRLETKIDHPEAFLAIPSHEKIIQDHNLDPNTKVFVLDIAKQRILYCSTDLNLTTVAVAQGILRQLNIHGRQRVVMWSSTNFHQFPGRKLEEYTARSTAIHIAADVTETGSSQLPIVIDITALESAFTHHVFDNQIIQ